MAQVYICTLLVEINVFHGLWQFNVDFDGKSISIIGVS